MDPIRKFSPHQDYSLPSFLNYSTDLPDLTEGTAANPLKFQSPVCPYQPNADWQGVFCGPGPTASHVFSQSNARRTSTNPFRWRVVVNNEPAWDTNGNSGPPNQSLAWNTTAAKILMMKDAASIEFSLANESDNASKIPYIALAYIRGVQGDPLTRICGWGHKPMLQFALQFSHSAGPNAAQRLHLYLHYRDPAGGPAPRYMPHCTMYDEGQFPAYFTLNWNWPNVNSYYAPGAYITGGSVVPGMPELRIPDVTPWQQVTVDIEKMALARFPTFATIKPDFLGFEIGVEGAYLEYSAPTNKPNFVRAIISDAKLTTT